MKLIFGQTLGLTLRTADTVIEANSRPGLQLSSESRTKGIENVSADLDAASTLG